MKKRCLLALWPFMLHAAFYLFTFCENKTSCSLDKFPFAITMGVAFEFKSLNKSLCKLFIGLLV